MSDHKLFSSVLRQMETKVEARFLCPKFSFREKGENLKVISGFHRHFLTNRNVNKEYSAVCQFSL